MKNKQQAEGMWERIMGGRGEGVVRKKYKEHMDKIKGVWDPGWGWG